MNKFKSPIIQFPNACPCCGYATLGTRSEYEICIVCWWEDDGQDNGDANVVRGGPNSNVSLTRARINFLTQGIFQPSRTDLRDRQKRVDSFTHQRRFVFDEPASIISEPAFGWATTIWELDDNRSQSLYNIGDRVRVVGGDRNKARRTGTIDAATWHHEIGIWRYRIVDEAGQRFSKRHAAPDLIAMRDNVG